MEKFGYLAITVTKLYRQFNQPQQDNASTSYSVCLWPGGRRTVQRRQCDKKLFSAIFHDAIAGC
jgi:hypothetical protein